VLTRVHEEVLVKQRGMGEVQDGSVQISVLFSAKVTQICIELTFLRV
jgi:hypothetical protein